MFDQGKIDWHGVSLIHFRSVSFELPSTEWLFFYSKNGVKFFKERFEERKNLIAEYKCLTYGPATLEYCSKYFDTRGHANSSAKQSLHLITQHTSLEEITFVRGENSMHSVQNIANVPLTDLVVYSNQPKEGLQLDHYDVAILTSPLNAKNFFASGGRALHYISIGPSTAKVLKELNLHCSIADNPTEKGISKTLKKLLDK